MRLAPQSSHASTWPPSAAVRQATMAPMTRLSVRRHVQHGRADRPRHDDAGCPRSRGEHPAFVRKRRSVRDRSGAGHDPRRAVLSGGMTSSDNRSNGLGVARIVCVAT